MEARTGEGGEIALDWGGTRTVLREESLLRAGPAGASTGSLLQGGLWAKTVSGEGFSLKTPHLDLACRQAEFFLISLPRGDRLDVTSGQVEAGLGGGKPPLTVRAGKALVREKGHTPALLDSPGQEFSSRFEGHFFRPCAAHFASRGFQAPIPVTPKDDGSIVLFPEPSPAGRRTGAGVKVKEDQDERGHLRLTISAPGEYGCAIDWPMPKERPDAFQVETRLEIILTKPGHFALLLGGADVRLTRVLFQPLAVDWTKGPITQGTP
jgi:hypothetical protein